LALVVVKDEIVISREPALVWNLITDISRWSRLNRLIKHAAVYGPLEPGTEFKFLSGKWEFDAAIIEVKPQSRFVFDAKSVGLRLRFEWGITEQAGGAKVNASIAALGWIAFFFKSKTKRTLEDDLFTWLYVLKTTLERGEKPEKPEEYSFTKPHRKRAGLGPLSFLFKHHEEE
jgi:hypothetical protein